MAYVNHTALLLHYYHRELPPGKTDHLFVVWKIQTGNMGGAGVEWGEMDRVDERTDGQTDKLMPLVIKQMWYKRGMF